AARALRSHSTARVAYRSERLSLSEGESRSSGRTTAADRALAQAALYARKADAPGRLASSSAAAAVPAWSCARTRTETRARVRSRPGLGFNSAARSRSLSA